MLRLQAFANQLAQVEPYFEGHLQRACFYALNFGKWIGLSESDMKKLYLGTFFHDAGKIQIPKEILQKPGRLTDEEFEVMKTHPTLGAEICRKLGPLEDIIPIVVAHHEKLDGTGYPNGLKDKEIPYLARIVAIIEIYDALRSERVYKDPFSLEKSVEILRAEAAAGHLDADLVDAFVKFGESQYVDPEIMAVDFFRDTGSSTPAGTSAVPSKTEEKSGEKPEAEVKGEDAPLTVLVAEDNADQMEIVQMILGRSRYRLLCAVDGEEALEHLAKETIDIALLDIMMPKLGGMEVCRRIREDPRLKNIYVIFLTALITGEDRVKGLELGANDYITKPFYLPELMARISVGERLTRERQQMEKQAAHDSLTGLHNRRTFEERLAHEFARTQRYGHPLSILMLDIDNFKKVNDQYGHHWGDMVIKDVGKVLGERTRKSDIAARYGGEEFIVLLPEVPLDGAILAGEKLRQEIAALKFAPENAAPFTATVSIGVASTSQRAFEDGSSVIKDADVALYKAKGNGKNRIESNA
jgi:diguanylate cyclase (GGDEF)-like protein/putative nucleotidyltransferase with HDIG domain